MASAKSASTAVDESPAPGSSSKKQTKDPGAKSRLAPDPCAPPKPWRVWTLRALTLCGLILSSYLIYQRARHLSGADANAGLCSLVKLSNCSKVENSAFAEIAGVPTAAWGAFFFLFFSMFTWFSPGVNWAPAGKPKHLGPGAKSAGKKSGGESAWNPFYPVATLLAVVGLGGSFTFAFIAITFVKAFCVGCAGIYLITALLALMMIGADGDPYVVRAAKGVPGAWRYLRVILAPAAAPGALTIKFGALAFLLLTPGVFLAAPLFGKRFRSVEMVKVLNEYAYASEVKLRYVPGETMVKGRGEAPIHIVVFTDFLCPHCLRFNTELKKTLANYSPDQYLLVYKHFPFEPTCNPLVRQFVENGQLDPRGAHFGACNIAALAQSLYSDYRGKFWDFSSDFYLAEEERQGEKAYDKMKSVADRAKIDYEEWTSKTKDKVNQKRVSNDVKEAIDLGITTIPAVYINNRRMAKPAGADVDVIMRAILNGEIDKLKSK